MGTLFLFLTGNTFHGNLDKASWKKTNNSKLGLDAIGKSNIPVITSFQGIDFEMFPWLEEILEKYPNIERAGSTYGHALLPILPSRDAKKWEISNGVKGNVPITFFSEFYAPENNLIPTEFFLVLEGQSHLYSMYETSNRRENLKAESFPNDALGIKNGNKIGIIMKNRLFTPLLKAFFVYQRNPYQNNNLKLVLDEIAKIGDMPEDTLVVMPIDLEAPYLGSLHGEIVWEKILTAINKAGLDKVFAPISDKLDLIRSRSVKTSRPHRELSKWTKYEVQLKHFQALSMIHPNSKRERMLYSIASCSDIFASWERKISTKKKPMSFAVTDTDGSEKMMTIGHSQEVIDVQKAAFYALIDRETFRDKLECLNSDSLFVKRLITIAQQYGL